MRTLAAISLSFAAAVFAAVLLPWSGWTWWAAIVCGAMGLAAVLLRRRLPDKLRLRAAVILFSLCGGLLYFGGYQALVQQPVLERCGREAEFSAVAADFGQLTEQGGRVTVYPEGLRGVKAVCYGGQELAQLEPGQRITGYARWQDAGRIHENDVTTFTSRGVFALLYVQGDVSASVSALVFTIPLTAIYFNILTLTAPISNLLAVPAAGWNFMAGFVTVLVGFVWLPAARVLGWVCFGLVRYVLWVAGVLASAPGHAVYFSNGFLKYWLLYVYAMFGGCLLTRDRRRKYAVAGVLAAATLALAVGLNTGLHQYGDLSVMALDVGQGESVALYTREKAVLVDCGSSNSYISAGARAADQLESMGIHRLSAVAVTHYHADHTNGLEELLARMPVERLLLPEIQDEYGVRDRLLALARELDIPVTMVTDTYQFPMDQAMLTIYPPVGAGDLNEQGLTFLCSAGDFDALITGDMAGNTEKKLVERFDLPDIEVLVVGHHGSRYSSTDAFLQQVRPETAIISVGDNSYGHPTQEAMDRLSRNGATVYRTDRQGNVLVTVNGGT